MRRIFLIICTFAFVSQPLHAEMIVLKNGRVLEGKTVGKTDEYVTLDVNGVNHTYRLDEISYMGEAVKKAPVVEDPAMKAAEPEVEDAPAPAVIEEATEPAITGTLDEEALVPAEVPAAAVPAEEPITAPAEEFQAEEAPVAEAPAEEIPAEEVPSAEAPVEESVPEEAFVEEIPVEEIPAGAVQAEMEPIEEMPMEEIAAPEAVVLPEGTLNPEDLTEPSLDESMGNDDAQEAEEMTDAAFEDTPPEVPLEETDQAIE